eukprot:2514633-Rhodomonas_salina.1
MAVTELLNPQLTQDTVNALRQLFTGPLRGLLRGHSTRLESKQHIVRTSTSVAPPPFSPLFLNFNAALLLPV